MPVDILDGVKRVRRERLERAPYAVPAADPDDVAAYLDALRDGRQRTASGDRAMNPAELRELTGTFRDVSRASPAAIEAARHAVQRIPRTPRTPDLTYDQARADMDRLLAGQTETRDQATA